MSEVAECVAQLRAEADSMAPDKFPLAQRLIFQEIERIQTGRLWRDDRKMVDVTKEKCIRLSTRVCVPAKEHPKFNFVGKLLGPKGNSLKRLQEETMTKMAILGRGSMRDKQKEHDLRAAGDPKFSHLADELHVEVTSFAPPAEAYARMAYAITEVRRFLVPDYNDDIRLEQMREMQQMSEHIGGATDADGSVSSESPPLAPSRVAGGLMMPTGLQGILTHPALRGLSTSGIQQDLAVPTAADCGVGSMDRLRCGLLAARHGDPGKHSVLPPPAALTTSYNPAALADLQQTAAAASQDQHHRQLLEQLYAAGGVPTLAAGIPCDLQGLGLVDYSRLNSFGGTYADFYGAALANSYQTAVPPPSHQQDFQQAEMNLKMPSATKLRLRHDPYSRTALNGT